MRSIFYQLQVTRWVLQPKIGYITKKSIFDLQKAFFVVENLVESKITQMFQNHKKSGVRRISAATNVG